MRDAFFEDRDYAWYRLYLLLISTFRINRLAKNAKNRSLAVVCSPSPWTWCEMIYLSEFTVIVFPLATGRYLFGRVPMLHYFAVCQPEQVIVRGMDTAVFAFAHAEHKAALGQNAMNPMIVDAPVAPIILCQRRPQNGRGI